MREKTYVFTREVKRWGVEAGDYYSPDRHMVQGGTEKLLADGVIEEDVCELCGGTGEVEEGEFDNIRTKKCVCQSE